MLNKRERKWLESREKRLERDGAYWCKYCSFRKECEGDTYTISNSDKCAILDTFTDYKDVALFEVKRVEYLIQAIKMLCFGHPKEADTIIKACADYAEDHFREATKKVGE